MFCAPSVHSFPWSLYLYTKAKIINSGVKVLLDCLSAFSPLATMVSNACSNKNFKCSTRMKLIQTFTDIFLSTFHCANRWVLSTTQSPKYLLQNWLSFCITTINQAPMCGSSGNSRVRLRQPRDAKLHSTHSCRLHSMLTTFPCLYPKETVWYMCSGIMYMIIHNSVEATHAFSDSKQHVQWPASKVV